MCSIAQPKTFPLPPSMGGIGIDPAILLAGFAQPMFDAGNPANFPAATPSPQPAQPTPRPADFGETLLRRRFGGGFLRRPQFL